MFIWVQVLRGLAAALVVCHHYVASQVIRMADVGHWLQELGGSGVDIFFVISGFIMMITQSDSTRQMSAKDFLWRRLVRIAPLYWALTATAFALVLIAGGSINSEVSPHKFLMSMLFLPYSESAIDMSMSAHTAYVIPMSWTLTYEWYFYLVFAITLALGLGPSTRFGFLSGWFVLCILAGLIFQPVSLILQVMTNPLVFEFLLGCAVAILYTKGYRLNGLQACILAPVAMLFLANIFHHSPFDRTLIWGLAAFALISSAVLYEAKDETKKTQAITISLLTHLGDISYSLYLSHFFTLALFVRLQKRFDLIGDSFGLLTIAAFILLTLAIAELCYRFIEEPARKFFARRQRRAGPHKSITTGTA